MDTLNAKTHLVSSLCFHDDLPLRIANFHVDGLRITGGGREGSSHFFILRQLLLLARWNAVKVKHTKGINSTTTTNETTCAMLDATRKNDMRKPKHVKHTMKHLKLLASKSNSKEVHRVHNARRQMSRSMKNS